MDTLEILRNMIIEEFELDPGKVQPDTDLKDLGLDSLSVIEFIFEVEDKFKVELPDRRVDEKALRTVRDIATELEALMAAQGRSASAASTS